MVLGLTHSPRVLAFAPTQTQAGFRPLNAATQTAPPAVVQAVIDAGAAVNLRQDRSGHRLQEQSRGTTPLLDAMLRGRADNAAVLLLAGADACALNFKGRSALHMAVCRSSEAERFPVAPGDAAACCELLLRAGVGAAERGPQQRRTPLELALRRGGCAAAVAPLLLAWGSPLPAAAHGGAAALAEAAHAALPQAVHLAQQHLDALQAPGALASAADHLEERLAGIIAAEAASSSSGGDADADSRVFAWLRALRSGDARWEHAWRHALRAGRARTRFSGALDRLAWARALLCCGEAAEAAAAERTVGLLTQLASHSLGGGCGSSGASEGTGRRLRSASRAISSAGAASSSREREKLAFAAACCVAKWVEIKGAVACARREVAAAEEGLAAARAQGEETAERLREAAEAAQGA